jgi:uncharacterized protein (TIGR02001 family)
MNHKLTLVLLGAAVALPAFGQAPAAPAAAPAVAITATGTFATQYMFRGQRLNAGSFQPTIEAAAGDLTLGVWGNFVIDDQVPGSSDPELDLYGSYTTSLGKDLSLAPGFTLYTYPKADKGAGFYKTTFEPNLALNYTVEGIKFTPKIYYDVTLRGATYEVTAAYAVALKDLGTELGLTAQFGTFLLKDAANGFSPAIKSWGDYWLLGASLPVQINKESKVILGVAYTEGRNAYFKQGNSPKDVNSLAVGRWVASVGYSVSF